MEPEVTGTVEVPTTETSVPAPDLQAAEPTTVPAVSAQEVGAAPPDPSGQQSFTVKVGGEDVQVSLDEALNGYMRQADYTRKTQEVAQQREELTYAERIAQALEDNPLTAIQALVTAYGVDGIQLPQGQQPAAVTPAEPLDPQEAFQARVESFIAQQEMRAFESQVAADLSEMHQQFGAFDDQAVIQYAVQKQIPDIKEAAKAFVVDRVFSTAQRQVAERQAQSRKETAPPVAGGHGVAGGAVQPGGTAPVNSIDEALALALAAHPGVTL